MKKLILLCSAFLIIGSSTTYALRLVNPNLKDSTVVPCDAACQDSIIQAQKDSLTDLQAKIDSLYKVEKARIIKPQAGDPPIAWINYFIGILCFVVILFLRRLPFLKKIKYPIIQRIVSQASDFMKRSQYTFATIATVLTVILNMGVLEGYTKSIADSICSAAWGISIYLFTATRNPKLIDKNAKINNLDVENNPIN